jgi:hypothetical protein
MLNPLPKSIYEGNGDLNGQRIPFFLLFQESKDDSVNRWIELANLDFKNLDNTKKNSKLVNYLLSKNVSNQWLTSTTMTQVVQFFIKGKSSASSLAKVKLPHPKFNNFNSRFCKTKQKYVIEHKKLRDEQVRLGPESAKHDKYYGSAIQNILPILEQSADARFYRLHPIWLLLLEFKIASQSPIPISCRNLNIAMTTQFPILTKTENVDQSRLDQSAVFQPHFNQLSSPVTSQPCFNPSLLLETSQPCFNLYPLPDSQPLLLTESLEAYLI